MVYIVLISDLLFNLNSTELFNKKKVLTWAGLSHAALREFKNNMIPAIISSTLVINNKALISQSRNQNIVIHC